MPANRGASITTRKRRELDLARVHVLADISGTLCASSTCRRPIEGACVVTAGSNPQRFHPGHLGCDAPHCSDTMEEYYELPGKRLCERHMERHVREARAEGHGLGKELRAEKRKTRLVDLPRGAF